MVNENEREDSEMCNTKILNYVLVNCVPSIYIPGRSFLLTVTPLTTDVMVLRKHLLLLKITN